MCRWSGLFRGRGKDRVPQVVRAGPEGPGRDHDRGRLRGEPEPQAAHRDAEQGPQRRPLRPLAAGEGRAGRALAQVGAELRPLRPRKRLVELLRDRDLGLGTCERPLQLFPEGPARAEDERLHRAHRHAENRGDLRVRATLDLAEDDGGTLVERKVAERAADVVRARLVVFLDEGVGDVVVELDLLRPPRRGAEPLQADVVRDRDEPVQRRVRLVPALERAVRVHERDLGHVLRVRAVAEHPVRVAVDVRRVPSVQALE